MRTLNHYTVTTGHNRVSPRSEVGPEAIAACAPLLVAGEHEMPGFPGYAVRVRSVEGWLTAIVFAPSGDCLVTMHVVRDQRALGAALRLTGAKLAAPILSPAVLVEVEPTNDSALAWLGDFERCLAWAWIESST